MPGLKNKTLLGYFETDYENPWPGLITNLPSSQIPPGACSACYAMVSRGRLTPQPAIFAVTGTAGMTVSLPAFALGENICATTILQPIGLQQGFTVLITNAAVYIDYIPPTSVGTIKQFTKVFTFPTAYPRYARFGTCVIGNKLYFSSASQLGVWCLQPFYFLTSSTIDVQITNVGAGYTSAPTVTMFGGGGTAMTGTATINSTEQTLASISFSGSGKFTSAPSLLLTGGLSSTGITGSSTNYAATSSLPVSTSASQTNTQGTAVSDTGNISGFTSGTLPANGIASGAITVNLSASFSGSGAGGSVEILAYASPDAGTTWYPFGSVSTYANESLNGYVINGNLPFVPTNLANVYFRGEVQCTIPALSPGYTVSGSVSVTAATFTITIPGGPAVQGSAQVILGSISGYQVNEVSAATGVQYVTITANGSGYTNPVVVFQGGGGNGATGTPVLSSTGTILGVEMDTTGSGYTSPPTVLFFDAVTGTGGSGATGVANLMNGTPFIGGDFMSSMATRLLLGNLIGGDGNTTSGLYEIVIAAPGTGYTTAPQIDIVGGGGSGATAVATVAAGAVSKITIQTVGTGFTSAPQINIISNVGSGAAAFAVLSAPLAASSNQAYADRVAWSAPSAPGYLDPNNGLAPGGSSQIIEARGLITAVNVVESVAFIGHSGGITEMTPNTTSDLLAFSFYPLWSADQGVMVRYGSMAQYGTTLAFLANDSAYTMTPSGLTEIGQNIANLLQDCSTWNNGNFPLQGLYGSIVLVEGQKHYLITLSSDDTPYPLGGARNTSMFDFNMNEGSWHQWIYQGLTATCPVYQAFDTAIYTPSAGATPQIAADTWILAPFSQTPNSGEGDVVNLYELAPLVRNLQLRNINVSTVTPSFIVYQFRTETPSIARMQSERRIAIEYESQPVLASLDITPTPSFIYYGQQDPTTQTGTVVQTESMSIPLVAAGSTFAGSMLTAQLDFGTFTGVCTSLLIEATFDNALVAYVRITQVAELMKRELP
jgi:hypothetical protein